MRRRAAPSERRLALDVELGQQPVDVLAHLGRRLVPLAGIAHIGQLALGQADGLAPWALIRDSVWQVLGVSLASLCNYANNLARTPLNPELSAFQWQGRQ